VYFLATS